MTNLQLGQVHNVWRQESIGSISYVLFFVGFLYYCIFPIVFISVFPNNVVSEVVLRRFPDRYMVMYLGLICLFLISFSFGYYRSCKNRHIKPKVKRGYGIGKLSILVTICYIGLTISIVDVREIISPPGYLDGYDIAHRGQLTTFYLVSIWWFIYLKMAVNAKNQAKLMLFVVFITGLNLLTLGSRLGVLTGIITLLIYYFCFVKKRLQDSGVQKLSFIKWVIIFFIVAILMSLIGILRAGDAISLEGIVSILAAEPVFIYASFPIYVKNTPLPLFAIPWDLFTGLAGAIPSALFPDKSDFFVQYSARNEDSYAGFGGVHHIVSLIANFGLIGFPVVAFFEGTWFGMLVRRVNANVFFRSVALSSIPILVFIMFREGLQTPVKLLFFNFLIFPYIMIQVLLLIKSSIRSVALPEKLPRTR